MGATAGHTQTVVREQERALARKKVRMSGTRQHATRSPRAARLVVVRHVVGRRRVGGGSGGAGQVRDGVLERMDHADGEGERDGRANARDTSHGNLRVKFAAPFCKNSFEIPPYPSVLRYPSTSSYVAQLIRRAFIRALH